MRPQLATTAPAFPTRRHLRCDATVPLYSYPGPALAFSRGLVDDREHDGPATCRPVSSDDGSIAAAGPASRNCPRLCRWCAGSRRAVARTATIASRSSLTCPSRVKACQCWFAARSVSVAARCCSTWGRTGGCGWTTPSDWALISPSSSGSFYRIGIGITAAHCRSCSRQSPMRDAPPGCRHRSWTHPPGQPFAITITQRQRRRRTSKHSPLSPITKASTKDGRRQILRDALATPG